jgi:undecaprenyl pyrophosphate phosphatase UppP
MSAAVAMCCSFARKENKDSRKSNKIALMTVLLRMVMVVSFYSVSGLLQCTTAHSIIWFARALRSVCL